MFWLLFIHLIAATQIPNFKWSQTNETLSITAYYDPSKIVRLKNQAKIELKDEDIKPKTKNHEISEEWLILSWNDFKLELHLREDIKKDDSWCKWKEDYVFCSLTKEHPHIFDFLSTRDQVKMLKPYATKDWEATKVGEFVDEYEFDDDIRHIDVDSIIALESNPKSAAVIRAFYPWCPHCNSEHISMEQCKRDKKIKKKKFKLYQVNAREDRIAGAKMNATCDSKCNFVVYYKGKMFTVPGKSKKKEFVEEIMYEIEDAYKVVKSEDKFTKMSKNDPVVGGYFEDTEGPAYTKFMKAAKAMKRRKDITYGLLARENPNWAKALVGGANRAILRQGKQKYVYNEFESEKNFTEWVEVYSAPVFPKYSYDLKKKWESVGRNLPVVKVFLDEDEPSKKLKRKVEKIAHKHRDEFLFTYYPKNQDHQMSVCGLQKSDKPAFAISTSLNDTVAKHYAFRGSLSPKHIQTHLDGYLADTLKQTFKTEVNPYDAEKSQTWEEGTPQKIVQTTWQAEIEERDVNVVLLMYKNWTTNREPAVKAMTEAAQLLVTQKYIKFALYDYHENYWNYTDFTDKKHETLLLLYLYKDSGERVVCDWAGNSDTKWDYNLLTNWLSEQFEGVKRDKMTFLLAEFEKFKQEQDEKSATTSPSEENAASDDKEEL